MIEVDNLTKYYGQFAAVRDVNFRVETGEIVGFLGPNGAGKTTTMRIITCFAPPTSGTVRVLGMDVWDDSLAIRGKIGYLPENVPLYEWMRVRSYLGFVAQAKGVPASQRKEEIARVAAAAGIEQVMDKMIRWLSKGYRQRVGLAQALVGDPPILILDEPTIGLDPKQIKEIRSLIKSFAQNRTVILSTHILPEVSQVCDRVIIINKGSIIAEDSPHNLTRLHGTSARAHVVARAPEAELKTVLSALPGVVAVNRGSDASDGVASIIVETDATLDLRPDLARAVLSKGWDLLELRSVLMSLEDVFIDLVTEESLDEVTQAVNQKREVAS
jgi:ABC-2 type transport system ATP-binding protein